MAKSCWLVPMVEYVPQGSVKSVKEESELFKDLRSKFKDRNKQVRLWKIANDPSFKEYVKSAYPWYFTDGNGLTRQGEINMPTLLSLLKEDKTLYTDDFKKNLLSTSGSNKEFDAVEFENNEAGFADGMNQVAKFNRSSIYRRVYKARLVASQGKYKIELVKWHAMRRENRIKFADETIKWARKEEIRYKILRRMATAGVHVKYVNDILDENITLFDPNGQQGDMSGVESGYRAYLGILDGSSNVHFLLRAGIYTVVALGENNENVRRCKNILMKPENNAIVESIINKIKAEDPIYGKKIDEILAKKGDNTIEKQLLALAYMVGQSIQRRESTAKNIPVAGAFVRLVSNIIRDIKYVFKRIVGDEEVLMSRLADKATRDFYNGEYGNAIEHLHRETSELADLGMKSVVEGARRSRAILKNLASDLKKTGVSSAMFSEMDDILKDMQNMGSVNLHGVDPAMREQFVNSSKMDARAMEPLLRDEFVKSLIPIYQMLTDERVGLCSQRLIDDIKASWKYSEAMQVYGDKLRAAKLIVNAMLDMMKAMDFDGLMKSSMDLRWKDDYIDYSRKLSDLIGGINTASQVITCKFLGEVIGADYVSLTLGRKFLNRKQNLGDLGLNITDNEDKVYKISENKVIVPISVLLNKSKDIGFIDSRIIQMGRVKDLTLQMIDQYNRKRQGEVREKTMETERRLSAIYKYAIEHNVNIDYLYELQNDRDNDRMSESKSENNPLTGNFISAVAYDKYDREVEAFKKDCWKTFKEEIMNVNVEDNSQWSLNARYTWNIFWAQMLEKWNTGNYDGIVRAFKVTRTFPGGQRREEWMPCTKENIGKYSVADKIRYYDNYRYKELIGVDAEKRTEQQKHYYKVYSDLISLKQEKDADCLDFGATKWYRAPQFKGSWLNEMDNRSNVAGALKGTRKYLTRRFFEDSDHDGMGDDRYHAPEMGEYDPFVTKSQAERHMTDRIPLYGINKLKDPQTLSTNAIQTLRAYTYMAENYKATRDVINTLEMYHDIVSNRSGNANATVCPNKVAKLDQYFKTQFYGMGVKQYYSSNEKMAEGWNIKMQRLNNKYYTNFFDHFELQPNKFIVTELVKMFNGMTTLVFLGGNLTSAGINHISAMLRLATEGIKGEQFTSGELFVANLIYLGGKLHQMLWRSSQFLSTPTAYQGPSSLGLAQQGKNLTRGRAELRFLTPPSKLELFMRRCDTSNDYQSRVTSVGRKGVQGLVRDATMFLYEWSDDYMSSIGFIAMALHTKLMDKDGKRGPKGKRYNLWNRLKVVQDENGEYVLEFPENEVYFSSEEKRRRYIMAEKMQQEIMQEIMMTPGNNILEKIAAFDATGRIAKMNKKAQEAIDNHDNKTLGDIHALHTFLARNYVVQLTKVGDVFINDEKGMNTASILDVLKQYMDEMAYGQREFEQLQYEARILNTNMHGIYNSTDRGMFQQSLLGSMISTMKGYFFGYFVREFIGSRANVGSGKRMSVEELMKELGITSLQALNLTKGDMEITDALAGKHEAVKSLIDESDMHDIYNTFILDTDIVEGTLVTCLKAITSPAMYGTIFRSTLVAASHAIPFLGQPMKKWLLTSNEKDADRFITTEQQNNLLRELGNYMLILLLDMMRIIIGGTLPPEDEGEEAYKKRLDDLVESLKKKANEGTLTEDEQSMYNLINISKKGKTDDQLKKAQRDALSPFYPRHEAKPTLRGLLYFCVAGSVLENKAWSAFYPGAIVSEFHNTLNIMPPMCSMLMQMYDNISLTYQSNHGYDLMKKLHDDEDLLSNMLMTGKEAKKKANKKKIIAAKLLYDYFEDHKGERRMPLPDINSSEFFDVTIDGVNLSTLSDEEKGQIRSAVYSYMENIWGSNRNLYVKGNDGRYMLNTGDNKVVNKIAHVGLDISTWGATQVTWFDDDLNERIKENAKDDEMGKEGSQKLVNKFYYGSSGYRHKKYDLKYPHMWEAITPYVRSLAPAAESRTGIEHRQYFIRGRR